MRKLIAGLVASFGLGAALVAGPAFVGQTHASQFHGSPVVASAEAHSLDFNKACRKPARDFNTFLWSNDHFLTSYYNGRRYEHYTSYGIRQSDRHGHKVNCGPGSRP